MKGLNKCRAKCCHYSTYPDMFFCGPHRDKLNALGVDIPGHDAGKNSLAVARAIKALAEAEKLTMAEQRAAANALWKEKLWAANKSAWDASAAMRSFV